MPKKSILAALLLLGALAGCEQSTPISAINTYDPRYDGLVMLPTDVDQSILLDQTKIAHAAPPAAPAAPAPATSAVPAAPGT
jgi:hypothetical protein